MTRRTGIAYGLVAALVLLLLLGNVRGLTAGRAAPAPSGCAVKVLITEADGGQVERWVPQPAAACVAYGLAPAAPGTPGPPPTAPPAATPPTATRATAATPPAPATPPPPPAPPPVVPPLPSPTPAPSPTATVEVGPGAAYATIGAATTAASEGALILIHAGTYPEQVGPRAGQTLAAYGDGQPWIDGECARPYGVEALAPGVTVRGLGIKRTTGAAVTARGNRAGGLTVDGATLQDFNCFNADSHAAAGVFVYYTQAGPSRVVNSTITYRVELAPVAVGYGSGIYFKSNAADPSGGGHVIAGNTIAGGWDGIGGAENGSARGGFDHDFVIERNAIANCADNGIEVEGGTANGVVRDNTIDGCPSGIGLAGVNAPGPLLIERNRVTGTTPRAGSGGGDCFKVGNSVAGAGPAYLIDNWCALGGVDPATGAVFGDGIKQTNSGLAPLVLRGNTFRVGRYVFEFTGTPPPPSSFDGDCLWTTDPARAIQWQGRRYSFDTWRAATGQEPGGRWDAACGT